VATVKIVQRARPKRQGASEAPRRAHAHRASPLPMRLGTTAALPGALSAYGGMASNRTLQRLAQPEAIRTVRRQEEGPSTGAVVAPAEAAPAEAEANSAIERARRIFLDAIAAYEGGAYSSALEGFQQVLDMAGLPDQVYSCSLWNIGQCYLRLGNREAAAESIRAYLASPGISDADRAEAETALAEITGGREGETVAAPVEGAEGAPTGVSVPETATEGPLPTDPVERGRQLHEQALALYDAGDYAGALLRIQQIMEIPGLPDDAYTTMLWNMARCYDRMGNRQMALAMVRGYLAQEGLSSADRAAAADYLRELAGASAEGVGERLPETAPTPPAGVEAPPTPEGALPTDPVARGRALFAQATAAYEAGRFAEALALFQQIVDIRGLPEDAYRTMLWNMARCYEHLGNNAAAIAMLRSFLAQPGVSDLDRAEAQALIARLQGT